MEGDMGSELLIILWVYAVMECLLSTDPLC